MKEKVVVHSGFIGLRLPDGLSERIRKQAEKEGMSISDLLRKIADMYVEFKEKQEVENAENAG